MVVSMLMVVVVVIVIMVMMVVIVIMVMVVAVVRDFLLAVDTDGEVRRRDAAAGDRFTDEFDAWDAEGGQFVECGLRVGLEFEKGGGKHVAGSAH
jgi:hypothetical protein